MPEAAYAIGLAIVSGQIKPRHFGNTVGGTRMEGSRFRLGRLGYFSEHLAGGSEVEPTVWRTVPKRGQDMVRAVDIGIERRELVFKRIGDKALRSQVIAVVRLHRLKDAIHTGQAFHGSRVKLEAILKRQEAPESVLRIFDGHPSHDPVHFIALVQ